MSRFDQKLAAGEGVVGTFSHLGGPAVAECLSLSGLDYVIIDTEHGPFPDESTGEMIRAIELHSAEAFVRVRDSSRAAVLHALDLGARGIIIPDVQSVEEARRLVEYAKYYPLGARGFAFSRSAKYGFLPELKRIGEYFAATNQRTMKPPGRWNTLRKSPPWTASTAFLSGRMIFPWRWGLRRSSPPRSSPRRSAG